MFGFFKKKKETERKNLADQTALGLNAENLARHSDAAQEFIKAQTGYDGTTGQFLKKSLDSIHDSKPNMPSQRGYAAEVLDVAKRNAEERLQGSGTRYSRVDDLPGHAVNETPYDIMGLDAAGKEDPAKAFQMKFNQGDPKDVARTLSGKKFQGKYPHGQYGVPKERYDAIKGALADEASSLQEQLRAAEERGDDRLVKQLKERLAYTTTAEKKLVPSKVSLQEAERAVKHPTKVTGGELVKLGHEAGVEYAQTAALIQGSMTFAGCVQKCINGEMTAKEAAKKTIVASGKSAGVAYLTGQANTMLAGMMKNSTSVALKKLGASSAPAQIVVFVTNVFRIVNDRMEGKISSEECFHSITKSGLGVAGAFRAAKLGMGLGRKYLFGALGSFAGPVGAIVGQFVAGIVISATYDYAVATLKAPWIARRERLQIERECEELHAQLAQYREAFKNTYIANTSELTQVFGDSLRDMAIALRMNDADSFIGGANAITRALGGKTQFDTVEEFGKFLESDEAFDL